jgi:hypothetical protein
MAPPTPWHTDWLLGKRSDEELISMVRFFRQIPEHSPSSLTIISQWTLRFITTQHHAENDLRSLLSHFGPHGDQLKDQSLLADFLFCLNSFFSPMVARDHSQLNKR